MARSWRSAARAGRFRWQTRFAFEPHQPIGIGGERRWQHFDRDIAIQLRIARAIHLAHAARTEGGEDFVRTETRAGGQRDGGEYSGLERVRRVS